MTGVLDGKVAIVTGAAAGVGRAAVHLFVREGAKVVAADVLEAEGEETVRDVGDAIFVRTDVTKRDEVDALVAAAVEHYGRLDVMTANAGVIGRGGFKQLPDLTDEEIAQIMDVNFWGVLNCFRAAIPAVRRAGGGAMTATSSIAAMAGRADLPIYSASKAAVNALVQSTAASYWPEIRVNAVSPGGIATEMMVRTARDAGVELTEMVPERVKVAASRVDRAAEPEEIAAAHLFLVSDAASYVTGQILGVDGGRGLDR